MKGWFASLPIQRKLIAMALTVSGAALLAAVVSLVAFDLARFRNAISDATRALAQILADNVAGAVEFEDLGAAQGTLATVRMRPLTTHACVYLADGRLFAAFVLPGNPPCPTVAVEEYSWRTIASVVPVQYKGRTLGVVYVARSLGDIGSRVGVTATAGLLTLLLAAALAFEIARKLQLLISAPIVALSSAAREIGRNEHFQMPAIDAPPDETGALVVAFQDMVTRLTSSNEALRAEIEERRRMQAEREMLLAREREASRLKDEFLAAVSHELRTPLNAISGWTQVLAASQANEQTLAKAIASILRNVDAQKRVIEDLLDVSRIIAGKLQMTLTAVDLRTAVESAIDVIVPAARAKTVRLEATLPDAPCLVQADFDRIRQVLWNVLSNAVKFTPSGGAISVSLRQDDGTYSIVVRDTGIGIAPGFLPFVFERFRQADGTTTREYSGLGLGLAIVKELTELHGGAVSAASPGLGQGATFTVTLPRLVGADEGISHIFDAEAAALPRLDGLTVLAIDDNLDSLEVITSALSDVGARVRIALSGLEALAQFDQERPDVVLCDLAMPGMDGFEVLRQIRRADAAHGRTTPVIALTAYASAEYRARCLAAGFVGHVAKPYLPGEVIREVGVAASRARVQPDLPSAS
jgi:signal transduction histidine kinase/ActR/RegA family two-component response regulator